MPVGDTVFTRLRAATDAEIEAFAKALEATLTGDRGVDVTQLSKEYRSTGGNSFANLLRGDHELPYREILVDAAGAIAGEVGWTRVDIDASIAEELIEDYVLAAGVLRNAASVDVVTPEVRRQAESRALAALSGKTIPVGADPYATGTLAILGVGAVGVLAGVAALPFGIAAVGLRRSAPNTRKTVPSTLILIQVRKRFEAEAAFDSAGRAT